MEAQAISVARARGDREYFFRKKPEYRSEQRAP